MKDLINRLRYNWGTKPEFHKMCREAADALEAQQAEIEALKAVKAEADDFTKVIANACQEAEKQVLALMEDKDRLDWIEANPRHAQIMVDGETMDCVFYGISCAQLVRLREAIDAIRRK